MPDFPVTSYLGQAVTRLMRPISSNGENKIGEYAREKLHRKDCCPYRLLLSSVVTKYGNHPLVMTIISK